MTQIWLTSDTHFGHERVFGLRGFATLKEHDDALRSSWARQVAAGDEVWILSDFSLGSAHLEHFETVTTMARLRHGGRSILLSHFPYDGDHLMVDGADRATQWRLRDEGRLLLHGHLQNDFKVRRSERGTTMIHVGLDAWRMKFVRLPELLTEAERYERVGSAPARKD